MIYLLKKIVLIICFEFVNKLIRLLNGHIEISMNFYKYCRFVIETTPFRIKNSRNKKINT